ncbi:hypothetical protein PoB_006840300 [Plakobranchus ocellatus]|uniref:Uncharacterized protein n=1 Tax=Plakobranchus ocellatus TaxID=259542 RepID=A0AAV4DCE7_9GAST|nr:hypothetical protein PoB_006840300 [Plakobranchus ocellatus]
MALNIPLRWITSIPLFLIGLYMSAFFENCDPLRGKLVSARNQKLHPQIALAALNNPSDSEHPTVLTDWN